MLKEPVLPSEQTVAVDREPTPTWPTPRPLRHSLRRCACSRCGTHAYRRLRADGAGPLEVTGAPATCAVCGGAELVALVPPMAGG